MKKLTVGVLLVLTAFASWQAASFAQNGAAPTIAFDITKAEIDYVLKNAPPNPPDRQLRVVDMGKYNLGVGIIHHGPTNDKPRDPIQVIYHDFTPETYIIVSGSGVLTTGGVIENKRAGAGLPNVMNGPSGGGTAGAGAYSRVVHEGDIIIIPNMVAHGWSRITDHVMGILAVNRLSRLGERGGNAVSGVPMVCGAEAAARRLVALLSLTDAFASTIGATRGG